MATPYTGLFGVFTPSSLSHYTALTFGIWIDTQRPACMMYPEMRLAYAHCPRWQRVRQEGEMTAGTAPTTVDRHWPVEGVTRVPFWAYSDLQVYEQEMARIFCRES